MNRPYLESTWQLRIAHVAITGLLVFGNIGHAVSDNDKKTDARGRKFENFKIDTRVYVGDSESPISSVQLFTEHEVIDALYIGSKHDKIQEITVFDVDRQRFVLLDVKRKIRLEIGHLQLLGFADKLRDELRQNDKTGFWLFPNPDIVASKSDHEVTVRTDEIRYAAQGHRPKQPWVLSAYQRFLDQYTLLSVTDPHRMPPFARIRLNKAIKKNGMIPEIVRLEVQSGGASVEAFTAHSKHSVTHRFGAKDLELIETAHQYQREFRVVELAEYRRLEDLPVAHLSDKP